MIKKSAISLISYDCHMLVNSIKSYYNYVDEIILGLDESRISWSKNSFSFDENKLYTDLSVIDGDNKIKIIEGNFHKSGVPIDNDTHERNLLKSTCEYDWVFSIDADEELINASEFFTFYIPLVEHYYDKIDLLFSWILPYKEFNDCYLVIANEDNSIFMKDTQGFVTAKKNTFTYCRWTNNERKVLSPLGMLHYSFCRSDEELNLKINNYGHSNLTKSDPFYSIREKVTLDNFQQLVNFKTSDMGIQWPKLVKLPKEQYKAILKNAVKNIIL